jgi:hypothetical protein
MQTRSKLATVCSAAVLLFATALPGHAQTAPPLPLAGDIQLPPGPCDPGGSVPAGYNVIVGNAANNVLVGTPGNDLIRGLGGNDYLYGNGGDDILCGGEGNDYLFGGAGRDRMWGGVGFDHLYGQSGNDDLFGDSGNDYLDGGSHTTKDFCWGGLGADTITATCETVLP